MIEFPPLKDVPYTDEAINARVAEIDAIIPSPATRAQAVLNQIKLHQPEFTNWDVICFAAEYLGTMIEVLPFLDEEIKRVARLVNYAHYRQPELVSGETSGA